MPETKPMSESKRQRAKQEVASLLWTLFPKEKEGLSLRKQKEGSELYGVALKNERVKGKTALAQLGTEHEHLKRKCAFSGGETSSLARVLQGRNRGQEGEYRVASGTCDAKGGDR